LLLEHCEKFGDSPSWRITTPTSLFLKSPGVRMAARVDSKQSLQDEDEEGE
jgi:hypothetical protein